MRVPGSLYRRYVAAVCRKPRLAALLLALFSLPALALTAAYFADVRAGLQELLPSSAPSVTALKELHARLGGQAHLNVLVQSDDPAANRRFVDELAGRLRERNLPEARSIQSTVMPERLWAEKRAPLLLPRAEFDRAMDEVDRAIEEATVQASPFALGLEDEAPSEQAGSQLQERLQARIAEQDRFPTGTLQTRDGKTAVVVIKLQGSEVDIEPSSRLLASVQREVDALRPGFPPELTVAYNGEVANLVEEHSAILSDMSLSTLLVFALVTALIAAYFRSWRAILAVGIGLLPGLFATFALGRLLAGSLNSNTAFLGSIIAGNGINYPLILLAYFRATESHLPLPEAIVRAARRALPGTLGAAATASAAYAGLASSSFKGFSQFGWLGGAGMICTWAVTFLAMPVAIALLDPPRQVERITRPQRWLERYFSHPRTPRLVAAAALVLVLGGLLFGVVRAARTGLYEWDLRHLRNSDSLESGSASWDPKMNEIFGVWLNPIVAMAPTADAREEVAEGLRRALVTGAEPLAERVQTIQDFVPPLADQQQRLQRIARLGAQAQKLREVAPEKLSADAWRRLDLWTAPAQLAPITVSEVPSTLLNGLAEVSGRTDAAVLLFPSLKVDFDDGRNVLRFADQLATAKLPPGTVVGGGFLFMAEIIRRVHDEAPVVVLTVAALVALLLVPLFGRKPSRVLVTVVTVGAVALASQALMVALGVRVNMLNFAAVPITIGVGADYVVNLFGAMDALGSDARRACSRMGGAILLCSLTTIVGYLSLVMAQSGALRSFGWAAVVGEVLAVGTVLGVLPVVLPRRKTAAAPETLAAPPPPTEAAEEAAA
ncbi:MAG: MMPL family transporter [Myxococcales bacterium]